MKYISILALLVLQFSLRASDAIRITSNMPKELESGKTELISFEITKGNLNSYAYFELFVPESFEIEAQNNENADFSYDGGHLRYTWLRIPDREKLIISFKLKAGGDSCKTFSLRGNFTYMQLNKRGQLTLPDVLIRYGSKQAMTDCGDAPALITQSLIEVKRETPLYMSYNNSYNVILLITNPSESYGMPLTIKEEVPEGFSLEQMQTNGAKVKVSGTSVVFEWNQLPPQKRFTISYLAQYKGKGKSDFTAVGKFTYTDNGKKLSYPVANFEELEINLEALRQKREQQRRDSLLRMQTRPIQQPNMFNPGTSTPATPSSTPTSTPAANGSTPASTLQSTQQDFKKTFN